MNSRRLLMGLGLGIILVGLEVEPWVLGLSLFFLVWKSGIEIWKLQKPPRWLINFLVVGFLAVLMARFRTGFSQEGSSSFLILLTSLKLLEERTLRDQKFLFLLGFVLISALLLFTLEIPALIGSFCSFLLLWSAQNSRLKYGRLFLRSLPLALFLFLFFPRVQNPFGFRGLTSSSQGNTGFSEELSPGSIAQLQSTRELAFRVQFLGEKKYRIQDQYWRGQVLTNSEGLRWTRGRVPTLERAFEKLPRTDYEVTLEPQGKRWLFAWEPTQGLQTARTAFILKKGHYFETVAPIYERLIYQGRMGDAAPESPSESAENQAALLQVPELPPRVSELANMFSRGAQNRQAVADAILEYFRTQNFTYSKNPGVASGRLEHFLFNSKKGYCEHYAASFATLLRGAGVPARVVTGYQGGEYNGFGNFWKFTQADAHAWTEYLNEQGRWIRVDPTGAVAAERLELGGELFAGLPEEWIGHNRALEYLKSREAWWIQARETLLQTLESWNYGLVLFLIDFNLEKQKELLREYRWWASVLGGLLLFPFLWQSFARRQRPSFTQWLLWQLEKKAAAKTRLSREPSETLRHFLNRWMILAPEKKDTLLTLLRIYEQAEYGTGAKPTSSRHEVRKLLRKL